jgi:rubrerythrin
MLRRLISCFNKIKHQEDAKWRCTSCGATCVTVADLKCGDPDAMFEVPYEDGVELVKRSACPLDVV